MSEIDHQHETPIKTPKQLIIVILASFLVPIIAIVLLVQYVTNAPQKGEGGDQSKASVETRIKPIAEAGFTLRDASIPRQLQAGNEVYQAVCMGCHAQGVAGAPKVGDKAAWAARIAQGYDTLVQHAIAGIRAMPAKGGNPDLDDVEVARAVVYMANQTGAQFAEPAATAPVAPTSTPAVVPVMQTSSALPATNSSAQASPPTPTKISASVEGKKLYSNACQACHAAGVAGAPKLGDKTAWAPRIKQGKDVLYASVLKGKGVMPPRGGAANATDEEIKAAVDYMLESVK